MAGWHYRLNGHEFGQTPGVGDGQGGLVCCGSWGHKESDMTERLNWLADWVFSKTDIISCDFFKGYEWNPLQLTLERLPCVLINTRTFLEGGCCLVATPRALGILSVHQHSFWRSRCCYGKRPQGGSIFHAPFFFSFLCNFILILYWNRVVSDVVFI